MSDAGPRYQARQETEHGCCFEAMVVDTTVLTRYGREPELICECSYMDDAILIADALNARAMS